MDRHIEHDVPWQGNSYDRGRKAHMISQTASAARSWLKVCFLRSAERKVAMEARLEMSPNRPRLEKRTPSHQNSNCFHTWA